MLAIKFTDASKDLRVDDIPMPYANAKEFVPVANITTIPVDVSALFQAKCFLN
jgi:hypothetical protein